MEFIKNFNSKPINLALLLLVIITSIWIFTKYNRENIENTTTPVDTTIPSITTLGESADQVRNIIKQVYQADVNAIKNLANVATQLQQGNGIQIPGLLKVNGETKLIGDVTANKINATTINGTGINAGKLVVTSNTSNIPTNNPYDLNVIGESKMNNLVATNIIADNGNLKNMVVSETLNVNDVNINGTVTHPVYIGNLLYTNLVLDVPNSTAAYPDRTYKGLQWIVEYQSGEGSNVLVSSVTGDWFGNENSGGTMRSRAFKLRNLQTNTYLDVTSHAIDNSAKVTLSKDGCLWYMKGNHILTFPDNLAIYMREFNNKSTGIQTLRLNGQQPYPSQTYPNPQFGNWVSLTFIPVY